MNVISQKTLREFWKNHADAKMPLKGWYRTCRKEKWQNLVEVQKVYPHADLVGRCTVFNIKGNDYRLITKITYAGQAIYIKKILTHAQYSKGDWKDACGC